VGCHDIKLHCLNGFRLPNQNPEAIARGNAFVATADNPGDHYNPAGIINSKANRPSQEYM
jgi:hypothetical protein